MKIKNMKYLFEPKTVAIIGASKEKGSIGNVILENYAKYKFKGKVFPINPKSKSIMGLKTYKSVLDVKEDIDLAVVVVPAKFVESVLTECYEKKVKAMVMITSGFDEIGNHVLADKIKKLINQNPEIPVVGPNCIGVMDVKTGSDTLFLPRDRIDRPKKGEVAFISQSGAVGSILLDWIAYKDFGISKFVSYGNACGCDESDLLEFFAKDHETKVIVSYLEGAVDGKKFFKTAKKVAKQKPIILIKGGMSEHGSKAVSSHTGSLSGNAEIYKAVVKQAGLVYAKTVQEMFDYARILAKEPPMKGKNVQIITDGGGFGVLATDALEDLNLNLAQMQKTHINKIKKSVPDYAVIKNPMDLVGDATDERYDVAIKHTLEDNNVDAILLIVLPQLPTLTPHIVDTITNHTKKKKKPIAVVFSGGHYAEKYRKILEKNGVTTFDYPSNAAKALKALYEFHN